MESKMRKMFVVLCLCAVVFHLSDGVLFTAGGFLIDKALAFLIFRKFLAVPFLFGKRSVSEQETIKPEEYLRMAANMDTDKCLPVAICAAVARSRDTTVEHSKFDGMIVQTFERKMKDPSFASTVETIPAMAFYLEAAKIGHSVSTVEACRELSPSCKFTIEELNRITNAVTIDSV